MSYLYLYINFFTIIIPFLFTFHPKLLFYKTWKAFIPAVIFAGIIFLAWDMYFTHLGVWGFNADYITGITIVNLPLEEVLFFFCIPYACVFTFHCLDILLLRKSFRFSDNIITPVLIAGLTIIALFQYQKIYTLVTFLSLAALLVFSKYYLRVQWLDKFYFVYAILLFPFLIVNGILTGTGLSSPVVWYNNTEIIGFRLWTIPVEDIFYGMLLILLNLLIYQHLKSKNTTHKKDSIITAKKLSGVQ
ncbi:MAG: lycopene cyclase domain-containing protein [Chitinophagaceae bacterium]|jgi:lycopene cyclase domain-containing protein|nr:lycopene cyclase domain-containing protein [Chitinophagaceae bacterium]